MTNMKAQFLYIFLYVHFISATTNNDCKACEDKIKSLENQIKQIWDVIGKFGLGKAEDLDNENHKLIDKRLLLTDQNVLHSIETRLLEQAIKLKDLQDNYHTTSGGAIFVHWGKPRCPDNTSQLVYSGYLGGSEYSTKGAAVTNVCLSPDPIFGNWSPTGGDNQMYGSELDTDIAGPGTSTQDNTCAVCRSNIHSTVVMIPGRNECYPGWKKQYGGYLMSAPINNSPKEIICLNEHPEFVVGGGDNDNGNLLYPIKAVCGSLECPPYVNGKLLTCAVCTQ